MTQSSDHERSRWLNALFMVGSGLIVLGCGPSFVTELTVDPSLVREDPLLEVEPRGATSTDQVVPAGTGVYVGSSRSWQTVGWEAFGEVLAEAESQGARFYDAQCLEVDPGSRDVILRGNKPMGEHLGRVKYQLSEMQLQLTLLLQRDAETTETVDLPDPSDLPPLDVLGCTDTELVDLNRWVR